MKLLTGFRLGILTAVFLMFVRFSPVLAATTEGALDRVLDRYLGGVAGGVCPTDEISGIFCVLANLIDKMITVAGVIVFLFLVYGGLQYMLSGGDEKAITASKSVITHAVLGLLIVLGAIIVLNTVLVNLGF